MRSYTTTKQVRHTSGLQLGLHYFDQVGSTSNQDLTAKKSIIHASTTRRRYEVMNIGSYQSYSRSPLIPHRSSRSTLSNVHLNTRFMLLCIFDDLEEKEALSSTVVGSTRIPSRTIRTMARFKSSEHSVKTDAASCGPQGRAIQIPGHYKFEEPGRSTFPVCSWSQILAHGACEACIEEDFKSLSS